VAALLDGEHDSVTFIGTPTGLEARLVPEAGVSFVPLLALGFDRARPWTLVTSTALIAISAVRAWFLMGRMKPDVVVGFGGYVSIPVGLAAVSRGIPLVLHEQNSVPGLANRFLSRWATHVAITYPGSGSHLAHTERAAVTGNPVRSEMFEVSRERGREALGLREAETMVLVFGGSRGARHINTAMVALCERIMSDNTVCVVHAAGRAEASSVLAALSERPGFDPKRWRVHEYLDDMASALAAADLVVARAGATSIAEITVVGLPAILVPYPFATDDHQTANASMMVEHGAAELVADDELDSERFGEALMGLIGDPARRATMSAASRALGRPDAAMGVADLVRRAARR
jgi:UDP-N-acetylglucosamine--N-acetylmuramyl-(pentapeptide) pyrophosphoryl-undecaprenol N-acetylglucosamine transferase